MTYAKEKEVAIAAATAAAKLCEQVRADIPQAIEKKDKSPVTVADFGAQAIICQALAAAFPDDPVVGEEDAKELRKPEMAETLTKVTHYVQALSPDATPEDVTRWIDHGNGQVSSRYWTLDPIDGTKGFLRQDQYAVALALVENGEVKVGVLACPAMPLDGGQTGALYVAVRGEGATMVPLSGGEPQRLQVVMADDVANFRFVESVEAAHGDQSKQNAIAQAVGITTESFRVDSQAKYGIVASGKAALYLRLPSPKYPDYRENIWDHAAGAIVVEEAGGRVSDMYGQPLNFAEGSKMMNNRGIVVSNGTIHDQVIAALAEN
ncbi:MULTISPECIES: 3'(2'),5'-bisphosphate nucleotidase [Planktothricoides]|uniref:3'(2'),5'-bisphosphate nucleotidase n=2 Tax=Planktothricoides raciborskii TaxID=132608 RepID=A0AAU8JAI3_9CYAN|nr:MULTISPECIES: 3'(2'),5'-bisphosphate nucleotidase [Planktothricoides]KOR35752.1 3'-5'-bisphosphate nucleotidase [Planktothricoides sp. SR001]MBD2546597.1 3'(2'),5'-bisphosphate nucleotidase [Planktothricoides raciborskii FACHB-1370]MBD2585001.1 3'(2'),5'-bisphosphate nucleotidase [Planktothricoides raciborskii FACHB-1261]